MTIHCKLNALTYRNIDPFDALPDEYPCMPPTNPILKPDGTVREMTADELAAVAAQENAIEETVAAVRANAQQAIADLTAIINLPEPLTAAQRDAAIKELARNLRGVIKHLMRIS